MISKRNVWRRKNTERQISYYDDAVSINYNYYDTGSSASKYSKEGTVIVHFLAGKRSFLSGHNANGSAHHGSYNTKGTSLSVIGRLSYNDDTVSLNYNYNDTGSSASKFSKEDTVIVNFLAGKRSFLSGHIAYGSAHHGSYYTKYNGISSSASKYSEDDTVSLSFISNVETHDAVIRQLDLLGWSSSVFSSCELFSCD